MKTITGFKEFTSIITFRTPIYSDGTVGHPEVLNKFTTEPKAKSTSSQKKPIHKKLDASYEDDDEVIEL